MDTEACPVCWAIVPSQMIDRHEEWHDQIASVAIESTQRIDALTARLNEVLDGRR